MWRNILLCGLCPQIRGLLKKGVATKCQFHHFQTQIFKYYNFDLSSLALASALLILVRWNIKIKFSEIWYILKIE